MREISKPDEHKADLKLRARLLPELYDTEASRSFSAPFSKMEAENLDKLELKTYTSPRKSIFTLVTLQSFSFSGVISAKKMQVKN